MGYGEGKGYSLNFPLRAGIDDANFVAIFEPVFLLFLSIHCR